MIDFYYICYSEPTQKLLGEFNQPKKAHQMLQRVIVSESEHARMANPENQKWKTTNIIGTKPRSVWHTNLSCDVRFRPIYFLRYSTAMHRVQDSSYSFTVNTLYLRTQTSIWCYSYMIQNPHAFLSQVRDFGSRAD